MRQEVQWSPPPTPITYAPGSTAFKLVLGSQRQGREGKSVGVVESGDLGIKRC